MAEGAGKRGMTDELMDFSDIAPTPADYAGVRLRQGVPFDGISLKPFLSGKTDATKPLIHGFISCSQLVRSQDHLLDVYNPSLGMPERRFNYTRQNRFWKNYERVDRNAEHAAVKKRFFQFLTKYPVMTADHSHWQTRSGEKFHRAYTDPKEVERHLHNHKNYKFYNEE